MRFVIYFYLRPSIARRLVKRVPVNFYNTRFILLNGLDFHYCVCIFTFNRVDMLYYAFPVLLKIWKVADGLKYNFFNFRIVL